MQTLLIDPVAFSIGSARVHWYGLILGLGALAGLLLAIREGSVLVFHKNFHGFALAWRAFRNHWCSYLLCSF